MFKRIFFSVIFLISSVYAMEKINEEPLPETSPLIPETETVSPLHKLKARIHRTIRDNPYLVGVKIINTSKLYTLRITGGTLNQTIQLNPVIDSSENGPQYDVKYLLFSPMRSITIEAFRPGSAIADQTQFRRLHGQDILVINVDRIPNMKKFYPPIIMIDAYSANKARTLYPNLDL